MKLVTFDSEPELYKLSEHFPRAHVLLRIKVDNQGSEINLSLKFGADPESAVPLLRKAKQLGLVPMGVAFHVGSQSKNSENYIQALEISADIFDRAAGQGIELKMLDIGGGFPIPHFDKEIGINFERMATQIRKSIRKHFDEQVKFIAEPGQAIYTAPGRSHKIMSLGEEEVEYLAITVPAWEAEDMVFLEEWKEGKAIRLVKTGGN